MSELTGSVTEKVLIVFQHLGEVIGENMAEKGFTNWGEGSVAEQIASVGLMHTELSEVVEAIRKSPPETLKADVLEEFADTIIRILHFVDGYASGGELGEAIIKKIAKNATRPHMHGGKRA